MKLAYRPEIDGLRAIAVLAVIIYHARDALLPGGFLGVDIFFVISGYLISSLILKELKLTNKFLFSYFYERRVRRIIPALLGVIIFSTFISYIVLLPNSFVDFSKSLISSIFSFSNFYFHSTATIYGADSSLLKPLLHTWSLSVEEQFYILFPVTVFVIYKFFKKYLLMFIFFGILISLIFSQYASIAHPYFNFWMLPSRGFELLLGSLLAKLELDNGRKVENSSTILNNIFSIIGILLIFYSLIFFNNKMLLPSFYSLVPIVGTMLVIWFSHKDELLTKILSNRIIVFFGLISYSLYLFHFPIFAFGRYLDLLDNNLFILIFFVILASSLSYHFIEKPFRNKKIISFRKLSILCIITIVILVSFNSYVIHKDGLQERVPKIFQNLKYIKGVYDVGSEVDFNTQGTEGNVLVIGDSHAGDILYQLNEKLIKENVNLAQLGTALYIENLNQINNPNFKYHNLKIKKYLNKEKNLIVIFHQRWTHQISKILYNNFSAQQIILLNKIGMNNDFKKQVIKKSIVSSINSTLEKNHKVILVYPIPENAINPIRTLYGKYFLKSFDFYKNKQIPIFSTSYDAYEKRNKLIFEILDSIQNDNIYRVYPHKYFCNNQIKNRCVANSKDRIYYYDDNHLSQQGLTFLIKDIIDTIKMIKKN
tara:strand:+ start:353 stop:2308 length:1956 start_codon:yes stop_codon:yes gene_type:complete